MTLQLTVLSVVYFITALLLETRPTSDTCRLLTSKPNNVLSVVNCFSVCALYFFIADQELESLPCADFLIFLALRMHIIATKLQAEVFRLSLSLCGIA